MPRFKNRHEVAAVIDCEGLGYFIESYTSARNMPDEELRDAFENAQIALREFRSLIPEFEDIDWDQVR